MGETVSTLVFRPPRPTQIKPSKFFYIQIPNQEDSSLACASIEGCGFVPKRHNDNGQLASAQTSSGSYKIPAFFIRRRGATLTFLFSHGNAEDLGMMYGRMKEMARVLGVNVLAYDYTGYGLSNGQPSEAMCYRNIEAAYNYLRTERNIPASKIVLYGRSLGSGPSCYLAKKTADEGESVGGLILHSPFLSIYRIVVDLGFNLVGDMFCNKRNAKGVRCPVFIIHGKKDEVVPFWHGDELLRSFPPEYRAEPFWVDELGHNNIEVYAKVDYVSRLLTFINRYVIGLDHKSNTPDSFQKREPLQVPKNERYNPRKSLSDAGKVFVNRTWVRHGTEIVNEAIGEKKSKKTDANNKQEQPQKLPQPQQQQHSQSQSQVQSQSSSNKENTHPSRCKYEPFVPPIIEVNRTTSELLEELREQDKYVTVEENDEISAASRYITTRDSMLDDEETVADEGEWRNNANGLTPLQTII